MELNARNQSIAEIRASNKKLVWAVLGLTIVVVLMALKLVTQTEIILNQTPGMPSDARLEKSVMDKGAQQATLSAVTSALAQTNPMNAEYNKAFVQVYLSPAAYTKVSRAIDDQVAKLTIQHELGSYYFVQRGFEYDPVIDKSFVYGDQHTVNAARDTPQAYVFEYKSHIENYRLLVDDVTSYAGDKPHDSDWLKSAKN